MRSATLIASGRAFAATRPGGAARRPPLSAARARADRARRRDSLARVSRRTTDWLSGWKPTQWKTSAMSLPLMRLSSGLEPMRLGETFTSMSHGLRCASSSTSKPKSSKQWLYSVFAANARCVIGVISDSAAMSVLTSTDAISRRTLRTSSPFFAR